MANDCGTWCKVCYKPLLFKGDEIETDPIKEQMWRQQLCQEHLRAEEACLVRANAEFWRGFRKGAAKTRVKHIMAESIVGLYYFGLFWCFFSAQWYVTLAYIVVGNVVREYIDWRLKGQ